MEMTSIFQRHSENRKKLQDIFSEAKQLFTELDIKTELQQMMKNAESLDRDSFKVLVVGEFKRGKSTFINALLGEEVLPAFATPCTAVINEIKYSDEKKAVLHFAKTLPPALPQLAPDVEAHIAQYKDMGSIPPLEIPVDRIEEFVVIPDPGKDQAASIAESPFSLVEIYWPIELCKNRVEIIDSPGLNEHGTRTKVTTDYLSQVDAVIFVLSCSALASQSELQAISDSIMACGHEDIFFVCNRFDEIREREKERVMDYARSKLADKTTLDNGIHFLSSLDALDAKIDNDDALLEKSRFPELEKNLISFLVNDRGRLKLLRPASALKQQVKSVLREVIPMRRKLINTDFSELIQRYEAEKPRLEDAEKHRSLINEKMMEKYNRIKDFVRGDAEKFLKSLIAVIPLLVDNYEVETKISTEEDGEKLKHELLGKLAEDIKARQMVWREDFMPKLNSEINDFNKLLQSELKSFTEIANNIMQELVSGDEKCNLALEQTVAPEIVIDNVESFLPQFIGGFVLGSFIGLLGLPVIWLFNKMVDWFRKKHRIEEFKRELSQNIQAKLNADFDLTVGKIVKAVTDKLNDIITGTDNVMREKIDRIKGNMDKILQVKKEGEEKAKAHEQFLAVQQNNAEKIVDAIEELIDTF